MLGAPICLHPRYDNHDGVREHDQYARNDDHYKSGETQLVNGTRTDGQVGCSHLEKYVRQSVAGHLGAQTRTCGKSEGVY